LELCAAALSRAGESPQARSLAGLRLVAVLAAENGAERALELLDRESLWIPRSQLRDAIAAAGSAGADAAVLARLSLSAGLSTADGQRQLVDELFRRSPWSDADWNMAAAVIAQPDGLLATWPSEEFSTDEHYEVFLQRLEAVQKALVAAAESGAGVMGGIGEPTAGWVQGCERCLRLLRERQCEPGAREFLRRLRVLFLRTSHPLRRELSLGRFPPPSAAVLVDIASREPWMGF
jgi:hypothetical protein